MASASSRAVLALIALMMAAGSLRPAMGQAVSILGDAYCDNCADGRFTDGDYGLNFKTFNATCTIKTATDTITAIFKGRTDKYGGIKADLKSMSNMLGASNVYDAFRKALFYGGDYSQGQIPSSSVQGCVLYLLCSICNVRRLNDGKCLTSGVGNGFMPNIQVVQSTSANSADLKFSSLCYAPPQKPESCIVEPPPGGNGDPHYTGADGSYFDFSGEPNASYCLISDSHLHINVFYGGRYADLQGAGGKPKSLTWIREMGILWGHHSVFLQVRRGSMWQYGNGYMERVTVDGEDVTFSQAGDVARFADDKIEVKWLAARRPSADDLVDIYQVKIADVLIVRLTLRPEIEMLRTPEDGVVHIDFDIPEVDISDSSHGILGQTFRLDHRDRLAKQSLVYNAHLKRNMVPGDNAEGFLDGAAADYRTSGVLHADCRFARFSRATERDSETARAIELASASATSSAEFQGGEGSAWRLPVTSA